jgi:hypothetical protein
MKQTLFSKSAPSVSGSCVSAAAPQTAAHVPTRRSFLMNTMVALPILVSTPTTAPAMTTDRSSDDVGHDRADALARTEQIIDLLRTCHVREGWKLDAVAAERALAFVRQYAKDGTEPDDELREAIKFFGSHGQSLDWVFAGDVGGMICGLAKHSKHAEAIADAELVALAEQYAAAEQRYCDLTNKIDEINTGCFELPEALRILPSDADFGRAPLEVTDEFWRRPCDIDKWRKLDKWVKVTDIMTEDRMEIVIERRDPSPELRSRADEIVAAFDAWKARGRKPRGFKKLEREMKKADREYQRIERIIADTRATTFTGLLAKIRCAQAYTKRTLRCIDNGSAAETMALSIFDDILHATGNA